MNKIMLSIAIFLLVTGAHAQSSLTEQINAVHAIEIRQQQAQMATEAAQQAESDRLARQRAIEARRAEQGRLAIAAAKKADAESKAAEAYADKKRDQSYEDQLRAQQIEEQKLKLQAMKARADRANDYIDQELHQQAAQADVLQSRADATRNLSEGQKALLQSSGEAQIKSASGWFK